jgi:hypothetical protein
MYRIALADGEGPDVGYQPGPWHDLFVAIAGSSATLPG